MDADNDDAPALAFEAVTARLEEVLALLERGDLPLEQALATYERGVELVRQANDLLDQAELRVSELSTSIGRTTGARPGIAEPLFRFDLDDEE